MKLAYKYIHFVAMETKGKTGAWLCKNNKSGDTLGGVAWYPPWRQYCFWAADGNPVFSDGCLADVRDFIQQIKDYRK